MKGEITVFLSLILTCICALMGGLLESARVAGSGWYLQTALNSSLDSLMSQYHREVWETYRLLLLEYDDAEELETELKPYLNAYLEADTSFQLRIEDLEAGEPIRITEEDGRYFEQEILDYMRLGILTVERDPDILSGMTEGIREAASLGEITKHYQMDTGKVIKLEQALEDIGSSLKRQEQLFESGKKELKSCDGHGFLSVSGKLKRELQRMPKLIEHYDGAAADLERELAASRAEAEEKRDGMKEETWRLLSAEMDQYRAYTAQEGERRLQVVRTGEQAVKNLAVVEETMEEAEETLEYIDEWESDDDEDELDEEPLWNAVLRTFTRFRADSSFAEPGVRDKKKMNLLQSISRLAKGELLSLVMPEGKEVSGGAADWSSCPSHAVTISSAGDERRPQAAESGRSGTAEKNPSEAWSGTAENSLPVAAKNPAEGLLNTVLIDEYLANYFTNIHSESEKDLKYEQEYVITGGDTDRDNLTGVVERLLLVREGMNLIHLLSDSEKRREAEGLAAAILGVASVSPLTAVTSFFILTVWAFAEAVEDLRALLRGEKIPFVKSRESWRLTLQEILSSEQPGGWQSTGGSSEKGMSYQDYLKLFFLVQNRREKNFRMMDLIQHNIAVTQEDFRMEHCAYQIEAECRAKGRRASFARRAWKAY